MKVAFIWPFDKAKMILDNWRDGQRACIEEIEKEHTVDWFLADEAQFVPKDYDFYLFWTDAPDPLVLQKYAYYKGKKGLMLTSDNGIWRAGSNDNLKAYDIIFCESEPVRESVRNLGYPCVKAHGTDDVFYTPTKTIKDIEYFYPATFSPWKRQSSIAKLKDKLWCVGTIQPDGIDEYNACIAEGVHVEVGFFPPEKIRDYYNRAKNVIIPSIHGSERTVLEAMSMDILPIVSLDNVKANSYLVEYNSSPFKSPRDFILENYSAKKYAQTILKYAQE